MFIDRAGRQVMTAFAVEREHAIGVQRLHATV
jgi:hypothetical protein